MMQVCFESEVCNCSSRPKGKEWTKRDSDRIKREPNNIFRGNNGMIGRSNSVWNGIWLKNRRQSKVDWRMMNSWKCVKSRSCFSSNSTLINSDTMGIRSRNKRIKTVSIWSLCNIDKVHIMSLNKISMDEYINMTTQAIDILHHTSNTMNDRELVSQKLLRPTAELVDNPSTLQYFLHCDTIANSVKLFPT